MCGDAAILHSRCTTVRVSVKKGKTPVCSIINVRITFCSLYVSQSESKVNISKDKFYDIVLSPTHRSCDCYVWFFGPILVELSDKIIAHKPKILIHCSAFRFDKVELQSLFIMFRYFALESLQR